MAGTPSNIRFRLINATNSDLVSLQISLTNRSSWEENILRYATPPGGFANIILTGSNTCIFDMKVVTRDGRVMVEYNIDLCRISTFTVY